MLKKLLATTALVAVAATASYAQSQPVAPAAPTMQAPAVTEVSTDALASKLIGQTVYNSDASNAEAIGTIDDLVVGTDGAIKSAVIGVGGFLGLGEKDVAIDFDQIKWSVDRNGKQWAVLATTKEQLESAPAFEMASVEPKLAGQTAANAPAANTPAMNTPAANKPAGNNMAANPPVSTDTRTVPAANTLATVQPTAITAKDLDNVVVYSADNKNVGEISDVVVDKSGKVDAVVVDVGGFLGIGEKPVAIGFNGLDIRKDTNNTIYVYSKLTKAQLDAAAAYDKNAYEAQREKMRITPAG
jgi:sporulation protein YlmC with PRC-barrel domain